TCASSSAQLASMGPGCFHPRNVAGRAEYPPTALLQWGRDVSIPEMLWAVGLIEFDHVASMGPGCFHPRNSLVVWTEAARSWASMGPGCFHPRNDSGNLCGRRSRWLQWGRDVSIPEMPGSNCRRAGSVRLHW